MRLRVVVAYRDRYRVDADTLLGSRSGDTQHRLDRERVEALLSAGAGNVPPPGAAAVSREGLQR